MRWNKGHAVIGYNHDELLTTWYCSDGGRMRCGVMVVG